MQYNVLGYENLSERLLEFPLPQHKSSSKLEPDHFHECGGVASFKFSKSNVLIYRHIHYFIRSPGCQLVHWVWHNFFCLLIYFCLYYFIWEMLQYKALQKFRVSCMCFVYKCMLSLSFLVAPKGHIRAGKQLH